ncbi:MAG: O-antigen ligase family protein [Candidatus Omnitrophota bacterium]
MDLAFVFSLRGMFAFFVAIIIIILTLRRPFYGLLFFLFLLIVQPQELEMFPGLETFPLAKFFAFFLILSSVLHPDLRQKIKAPREGQNLLFILFAIALVFSGAVFIESYRNFSVFFLPVVIMYFLVISLIKTEKQFTGYILMLVTLTTYLAIYGIFQYHISGGNVEYEDGLDRILYYGSLSDPNNLAMVFVLSLPFILNFAASTQKIVYKLIFISAFLLHIWAVYLTYSRSGFLGLGAVLMMLVIKSRKKIITGPIVLLLLFGLLFCSSEFRERMMTMRATDTSQLDRSAQLRIELWKAGIAMAKEHPYRGVGIAQFEDNVLEYISPEANLTRKLTAHNSFILIIAETGVVGFILYVLIFLKTFSDLLFIEGLQKKNEALKNLSPWAASLFASLVGVMIIALFLTRSYQFLPFILVALTVSLKRLCFFKLDYSRQQDRG